MVEKEIDEWIKIMSSTQIFNGYIHDLGVKNDIEYQYICLGFF
jgi:hypothetical protein